MKERKYTIIDQETIELFFFKIKTFLEKDYKLFIKQQESNEINFNFNDRNYKIIFNNTTIDLLEDNNLFLKINTDYINDFDNVVIILLTCLRTVFNNNN